VKILIALYLRGLDVFCFFETILELQIIFGEFKQMGKVWGISCLSMAFVVFSGTPALAGPFDSCNKNLNTLDGRYEFVWKPTGAHRPDAVLVLPSRFKGFLNNSKTTVVKSAVLYQASTLKKIDTMQMKSTGYCPMPPFLECLNRPTFNSASRLTGKAFKRRYGNLRLRVETNGLNNVYCTPAFNPAQRQD
jgi:hypothetical protein